MADAARTDVPIFVVGFQRSGTTLLQALIGSHSRVAAPPEMHFLLRISWLADYYGDLTDDANLRHAVHDTLHPPLDLLDGCGFVEDDVLARARRGPRTYAALLDAVLSDYAERQAKARWCEKTPEQRAVDVRKLFPDAPIVHIVRDPRSMAASSLAMPWERAGARELARRWASFTEDNLDVDGLLLVRYEALTSDPEAVLRRICAFIGEEFEPDMLHDLSRRRPAVATTAEAWQGSALRAVAPADVDGWKRRLTRAQRGELALEVQPVLRRLGYPAFSIVDRALGRARQRRTRLDTMPGTPAELAPPAERYRMTQQYLSAQAATLADDGA